MVRKNNYRRFTESNDLISRSKAFQIKKWDEDIRNYGGDESIWEYWITYGVPDHIEEWDINEYATQFDNNDYDEFKRVYNNCQQMIKDEEDGVDNSADIDYVNINNMNGDFTQYAKYLIFKRETPDYIYAESPTYGWVYKIDKRTTEVFMLDRNGNVREKLADTCEWHMF